MCDILNEEWKLCTYPGVRKNMYEISNHGNVRNIIKNRLLKYYIHTSGYLYINLMTDSEIPKSDVFKVHRLVAWEFVPGFTKEKNYVNHKDGVKTNPFSYNLEWCTFAENIRHAFRTGLVKPRYGTNNSNSKINDEIARVICETLLLFNGDLHKTYTELLRQGIIVTYDIISSIKYKKRWCEISDKYFSNETFPILTQLTPDEINTIKQKLNENKTIDEVYNELKDSMKNINRNKVYKIKYKMKNK